MSVALMAKKRVELRATKLAAQSVKLTVDTTAMLTVDVKVKLMVE